MRARSALATCALVLALAGVANAALARLNVASFTFSADTSVPAQEQPFHLILDVRLNGHVDDLEGVVLPQLGTLEILGDEKHTLASGANTEYRETIAVVAHQGGAIAIPPAYLDAIDARDGKPKRFLSNDLTLHVAGPASVLAGSARSKLFPVLGFLAGAVLIVALALAALKLRKAPPDVPAVETAPVQEPVVAIAPADAPADAVAGARARLAVDPTREGALASRSVLWRSVGASDGETLADVVRRPGAHDPALRAVLRALERAAFTNDLDRPAAIGDALRALDGYRA